MFGPKFGSKNAQVEVATKPETKNRTARPGGDYSSQNRVLSKQEKALLYSGKSWREKI